MATTTPNIGLTLPIGTEKVSRQIINTNNTKIDTAVGTLNGNITTLNGNKIIDVTDYNLLTTTGVYKAQTVAGALNPPDTQFPNRWYNFTVWASGGYITQIANSVETNKIYIRQYFSVSGWTSWKELVGKNDITPSTFSPTTDTSYFTLSYNFCKYITSKTVHVQCRVKVNTVPSGNEADIIILPQGMTFSVVGMVLPAYKSISEWSTPSSIIYCYQAQNKFVVHSSDLQQGCFIFIDFISVIN